MRLARRDEGQAVVLLALSLPLVLALLLLVIDGGRLYLEGERLRNAAQLAAEAGVSLAADSPGRPPADRAVRDMVAQALARNLPGERYEFQVDIPFRADIPDYNLRVRVSKAFAASIQRISFPIVLEAAARLGRAEEPPVAPAPTPTPTLTPTPAPRPMPARLEGFVWAYYFTRGCPGPCQHVWATGTIVAPTQASLAAATLDGLPPTNLFPSTGTFATGGEFRTNFSALRIVLGPPDGGRHRWVLTVAGYDPVAVDFPLAYRPTGQSSLFQTPQTPFSFPLVRR